MKLSRAKAVTSIVFIAFCLLFSYQFLIFAQQPATNIQVELQELLQGKTLDFSSAAAQLKEADLPAALTIVELLKFKALHQEIPASIDQITLSCDLYFYPFFNKAIFSSELEFSLVTKGYDLCLKISCNKKINKAFRPFRRGLYELLLVYSDSKGLLLDKLWKKKTENLVFPPESNNTNKYMREGQITNRRADDFVIDTLH